MDPTCYVCSNPEATPGPDGVPRCGVCAKDWVPHHAQVAMFERDNYRQSDHVFQPIPPSPTYQEGHVLTGVTIDEVSDVPADVFARIHRQIEDAMREAADHAEARELDRLVRRLKAEAE